MDLELSYNPKRQSLWIQRLKKSIVATQAELDKELPSFEALEEDYKKWKTKIDAWKEEIASDKEELATFEHAQKFPADKIHKPRLANDYTQEPVQQQVVKRKQKFIDAGKSEIPLPQIRWVKIIEPALLEINKFIKRSELWKYLVRNTPVYALHGFKNDDITKTRFEIALNSKKNKWFIHHTDETDRYSGYVGLRSWDISKHLNDFYKQAI